VFASLFCFPVLLWVTDTGQFGSLLSAADTTTDLIIITSAVVSFCPLVVATAVGLFVADDR
jgi:hypothetical protein